jgi:hypothetical protein
MNQTAPAQARTGHRRHRGILALLAALACLAGLAMAVLKTSPSGPATSPPGTVTPGAGTAAPRQAVFVARMNGKASGRKTLIEIPVLSAVLVSPLMGGFGET